MAPTPRLPVRSKVFAGVKNVQELAACLDAMRSGIGCEHSKRADVSKFPHWLQACSAPPHLRHVAATPIASTSSTFSPQCLQRKTTALSWSTPRPRGPSLRGGRGPFGRGPESEKPESW